MMKELDKISPENPFKVPENYFDEMKRKIISETAGYSTEIKKKGLYRTLRPYLAVAATVAGFIIISYTASRLFNPDINKREIPETYINEFSDLYLNDIDILTLEENAALPGIFKEETGANTQDIIDYLVLENFDVSDIYEL